MENLQNIKVKAVLEYFEEISNIPRGSGNEKEISDYLVNFAKRLKLEVIQDKALNIIIKKPATKGYENSQTVILQGHMDMVCQKNTSKNHNFKKDPIKLIKKGDYIYADGTTLGADDGIAVAYAMAILSDDSISHPNLEVLLTTDEEAGMTGAMNISKEDLKGKILINIDTEEEGYLLVSCAGGIRTKSKLRITKEPLGDGSLYKIKVRGLKGGHSGCDIDKWRGNSNKIIGRVLKSLQKINFNLVNIEGGSKNNAIPREADAVIVTKDKKELFEIIKELDLTIRNELKVQDSKVKIEVNEINEKYKEKIKKESQNKIIDLLYMYPDGINTISMNIEGLIESSTNLGIVRIKDNLIEFDSAVRSSVPSLRDEIVNKIRTITEMAGGGIQASAGYPSWEYKEESRIREVCKDVYKKMYHKEMKVYAIHAGVECGLFEEKLGEMDMVSLGPDIFDAHTPEEHLSISSAERVYEYLLNVLKEMKNY